MAQEYIERLPTDHVVPPNDMQKKVNEIIDFIGARKPDDQEEAGETAEGSFKAGPVDRTAPSPQTAHSPGEAKAPEEEA